MTSSSSSSSLFGAADNSHKRCIDASYNQSNKKARMVSDALEQFKLAQAALNRAMTKLEQVISDPEVMLTRY